MILSEIIDTKEFTRNTSMAKYGSSALGREKASARKNAIGHGFFSYVKPKKNDPHMVQKINKHSVNPKQDAYYLYIKYIVDHNLASENPYFPRVYRINHFGKEDKPQAQKLTFEMERLVELEKIPHEQQQAIYEKLTGKSADNMPDGWVAGQISNYVGDALNMPSHLTHSPDDQFNEAVSTIRMLASNQGMDIDMKPENVMVRLTPHGAQLVITDPVFS